MYLHIHSILHPLHSAALSDRIDAHNPDLFSLTETWKPLPLLLNFTTAPHLTKPYSVSHANSLATTLALAVAPAFSSANLSHSYLLLFIISRLMNRLPLLSSFLALNCLYLTHTALLPHLPFLNHSLFFLTLILSFLLLLPHIMNSSSPTTLIFTSTIPLIASLPSFCLFSPLSTSVNT